MPIYSVKFQGEERLVKASTTAGARNHVLKPLVPDIQMLDGEGVADAMQRGAKIEDASAPDPDPAPAGEASGDDVTAEQGKSKS